MRAPTLLVLTPLLAVATLAAAPAPKTAPPTDNDAPQIVSIAIPVTPAKDAARLLLLPYAKATGTTLGEPAWDGTVDGLHRLEAAHGVDLALLDGATLAAECHGRLLDRVDWSSIGRDRFLPQTATECGVGAYVAATVLAWDSDKLQGTPGWGDFWDIAQHPGRRGLHRGARGNLEIALLADGVAPGDLYRTLRSADGVDRAFRKLDQLKPYIVWWDQPGQPAQLLASSKVLLTSAPSSALPSGSKSHVGLQWGGSLQEVWSWGQPAGAAHKRGALALVLIATDSARQAEFARQTDLGPATSGGLALLPTDLRSRNPASAANLQAGLSIDEDFWRDIGSQLETRFTAWVAK